MRFIKKKNQNSGVLNIHPLPSPLREEGAALFPRLLSLSYTSLLFAFFLIFAMFFTVKTSAQPKDFKPFRMIFLPDTHISFEKQDDWILYKESFVTFQETIKSIKSTPGIDFVVFGGDLVDNKDKTLEDLPFFLDSIYDLNTKYYAILGDRDADLEEDYTKQHFCAEFRRNGFDNPYSTYWTQEPVKNVLLIGLDTSIKNKFEGKISPEQLIWLDEVLKSNCCRFTIITMHHPAVITAPQDKNTWKRFVLENSDEFLNVINKYPQVKLILSGHHHNYAVQNINGKLFISTPSIVTYPNQYQILTVYPDKIEIQKEKIPFNQIIKKAKKSLVKTQYAKEFDAKKPKKVLRFQEGGKIRKKKTFSF